MLVYLAALLLATVPGAVLGWAVPGGRQRWVTWAASPALTLGLAAAAMGWLGVARLPTGAMPVLVAELVLAAAGVGAARLVSRRRARNVTPPATLTPGGGLDGLLHRAGLPGWRDLVAVGVPSVLTVSFGYVFLGRITQPPGWDAMNHAFFVRRIMDSSSTSIGDVCVTGSTHIEPSCSFYPLAANVLWAQTAELTGGRVGTTMLGWGIVVAPLAMVVGVYAAVRVLGGRRLVAACAAAMPSLLGPMWMSLRSGRMTEQAAPCMAAAVALLVALALRGRHPYRLGALSALAGAGIVMSHSYDVLFIGTVAVVMAVLIRGPLRVRSVVAAVVSAVVTALVVLLPSLGQILGANAERTSSPPTYDNLGDSFHFWVVDFDRYVMFGYPVPGTPTTTLQVGTVHAALMVTLVALAAAPLSLVLRPLRWARPWVVAGGVWTLIGIWTSYSRNPLALALSGLWYGIRERVRNMILPVYGLSALAGACAIGIVLWWLVRLALRGARRSRFSSPGAAAVAGAAFVAVLLAFGVQHPTWEPLRADLLKRSPSNPDYTKTYLWLDRHTAPDAVVAYDRHLEFMTWSYADYDTGLLFGIPPLIESSLPDYDQRWAAFDWLVNNKDAKPAGCLVRKYDIQYLAVGKRRMPSWKADYQRARLAESDRVRLVHRDGDLRVFEVTDAGRACPGASG